jgi:hypothetical protein
MATTTAAGKEEHPYTGWIAGAVIIAGVLGVGAAFWMMYHG